MNPLRNLLPILFLLTVLATACNEPKEITAKQPERSFVLGSGGGITGAYEMFRVNSNGKIEVQLSHDTSYSFLKTLPKDSTILTFENLDALNIEGYDFNRPGNMTFILELESSGKTNTIKWGAANQPVRPDIDAFFKRTAKMIRADYE